MSINRNGYTENVSTLITSSLSMLGVLGIEEDDEQGYVPHALRELNLIVASINDSNCMQFDKSEVAFSTLTSTDKYTIGSGQGYISDSITQVPSIGDQIVFTTDIFDNELGQYDIPVPDVVNAIVYTKDGVKVLECTIQDAGPNLVVLNNELLTRLDPNETYILYTDTMPLPDIICVNPDSIPQAKYVQGDVSFTIRNDDTGFANLDYTDIPRTFQYRKGSLGTIRFSCNAQPGDYRFSVLRGVPQLSLGTMLRLPSAMWINFLQLSLVIRLGPIYGKDITPWMRQKIILENKIGISNIDNFDRDDEPSGLYSLRNDGWS